MPIKGNWRKDFEKALIAVKDSKTETLKTCATQILQRARRDYIIYGATKKKPSRRGGYYLLYLETSDMNRYSKPKKKGGRARIIYNQSKFVNRTGNLAKSLTPAGGWGGNTLNTRGEGEVKIITAGENTSVRFIFRGRAEGALKGADSKKGRGKATVEITDINGNVITTQTEHGRRRPLELANKKVAGQFAKILKQKLDVTTKGIL